MTAQGVHEPRRRRLREQSGVPIRRSQADAPILTHDPVEQTGPGKVQQVIAHFASYKDQSTARLAPADERAGGAHRQAMSPGERPIRVASDCAVDHSHGRAPEPSESLRAILSVAHGTRTERQIGCLVMTRSEQLAPVWAQERTADGRFWVYRCSTTFRIASRLAAASVADFDSTASASRASSSS